MAAAEAPTTVPDAPSTTLLQNRSVASQTRGYEVRLMHLCHGGKFSLGAMLRLQQRHMVSPLGCPDVLAPALWGPCNTVTAAAQYAAFWMRAGFAVRGVRAWAAAAILDALVHGAVWTSDMGDASVPCDVAGSHGALLWSDKEATHVLTAVLLNTAIPSLEVHRYLSTPRTVLHTVLAAASAPAFHQDAGTPGADMAAVVHWHLLQVASLMLEAVAVGAGATVVSRSDAQVTFPRRLQVRSTSPFAADEYVGVYTVQTQGGKKRIGRKRKPIGSGASAVKKR